MADYDDEDFEEDFEEEELEEEELSDGGGFGAKPAPAAAPASKPSPSKMMGSFQPTAMLEAASSDDDGSTSIKSASSGRSATMPPARQLPPAASGCAEPDVDDMLGNLDALPGCTRARRPKPEPPAA